MSSKTGFGLAEMLHNDPDVTQRIIGLTSPANVAFVDRLGCCGEIFVYGEEANSAAMPALYPVPSPPSFSRRHRLASATTHGGPVLR